jgi:hypothetical protein
MASHQQGEIEGRRQETQSHPLWTLHYIREKWYQCFSFGSSNLHAYLISGERWELETF